MWEPIDRAASHKHNTGSQTMLNRSFLLRIQHMNVGIRLRAVFLLMAASAATAGSQTPSQFKVASPDARTEVLVGTAEGRLVYSVRRDGRPLVLPSVLGFEFRGAPMLRDSLRVTGTSRNTYDSTWTQPWGEVAHVRDHQNELRVSVAETTDHARKFHIVFGEYSEGTRFW